MEVEAEAESEANMLGKGKSILPLVMLVPPRASAP